MFNLPAAEYTGSTEVIFYNSSGRLTLWDSLSQSFSSPANIDAAINQAVANLGPSGGTIRFGKETYSPNSTHVLSNISVVGENESSTIISPGASFSGTAVTGFTNTAIFNSNGNNSFEHISFNSGTVTANAINQIASGLYINRCPSEILYEVSAPSGSTGDGSLSCNARISNCNFTTGGGVVYTINGAAALTFLDTLTVEGCTQNSTSTVALIAPDPNLTANDLGVTGAFIRDNRVNQPAFTGLAIINFGGTAYPATLSETLQGTGGGSGASQITHNQFFIKNSLTAGVVYTAATTGTSTNILSNEFGLFSSPGVTAIQLGGGTGNGTGGGNCIIAHNNIWGQGPHGFGTTNAGIGINVNGDNINLVNIIDNTIIAGGSGIDVTITGSGSLTNGYAFLIANNRLDKFATNPISVTAPSGGVIGEFQIVNNYCQNPNWGGSGTAYAAIVLTATGSILGPCLIQGNRISTHQGQAAYGIQLTGTGTFGNGIAIRDNPAYAQNTGGTTTPSPLNHSIQGNVFTAPGSFTVTTPASGTTTQNPTRMPGTLVITGSSTTAITINGVTVVGTTGNFELDSLDTFSITY